MANSVDCLCKLLFVGNSEIGKLYNILPRYSDDTFYLAIRNYHTLPYCEYIDEYSISPHVYIEDIVDIYIACMKSLV